MSKQISSLPEAIPFRTIVVIIIVLICISSFLYLSNHLSEKAQLIARDQVITDIKYSLAMALYDFTIKGKQDKLVMYKNGNPFDLMRDYSVIPLNYHGETSGLGLDVKDGWYYDYKNQRVVYTTKGKRQLYVMDYVKEKNGVGRLELKIQ